MHLGVTEQFLQSGQLIGLLVVNLFDARVDQNFEAVDARRVGDVDRAVFDAGAVLRRLSDGVHLRMDGAKTVLLGIAVGRF